MKSHTYLGTTSFDTFSSTFSLPESGRERDLITSLRSEPHDIVFSDHYYRNTRRLPQVGSANLEGAD
jgi:hypothetical protein